MKKLFTTKANSTVNTTKTTKGVKTMKKTSIFKKIIVGVLSAITVLSVGTMAPTSASAAETGAVESVKYKGNTIYYSDDYFRRTPVASILMRLWKRCGLTGRSSSL